MLRVKIICVGKLKEKYLRDAAAEYMKRLSAFCKVQLIECAEERLPEQPSKGEIDACLKKESERIRKEIPPGAFVYSMQIEGKQMTSEAFAAHIQKQATAGKSTLVFLIGSSFGLDEALKEQSDFALSFSQMTFPHQLARIMLLEQVYRAFSISAGTKYHK
ncbi:MAG: 23S rRNA (pseudouridine(1915)-N(3))-methyltransferase RlmH [Clostridia bacterium]|nr:23S rRNA (pseudouridine(1915)-N(3))-methyltransferase RlmH [Clostridia bacterium]